MTTLHDLLDRLRARNIVLRVEDGALRFRAPKGALTPALRDELQASSAALIAHLRPAEESGEVRMSLAQERIWFLYRLEGPSSTYSITPVFRLRGALSREALATALNTVARRHETLRTRFTESGGVGMQIIDPPADVPVRVMSLAHLGESDRLAAAERVILEETARPFDLEREHSLRVTLIELGADDHILLPFMHHIVADGWSLGVFQRELNEAYAAAASGREPALPPVERQYRAFALQQREALAGERGRAGVAWWASQLAGAPQTLSLPLDFERPAAMTFNGRVLHRGLPASTTAAVNACARASQGSLFMVLLAAYAVLLHRHSGQGDLLIGSPIAGRTTRDLEGVIGCFVNTLVMRIRVQPGITFTELVKQVRQTALDAYQWQDIPVEAVIDGIGVERDPSRMPLFQAQFSLQNVPVRAGGAGALRVEPMRMDRVAAKNDLSFILEQHEDGIDAEVEYNTDLFEESTVAALWDDYARLLNALVASPDRVVDAIAAWPAETHAPITANEGPADLAAWFDATAAAHGDRLAVSDGASALSYAQLARRSDAIAAGIGADAAAVAILTQRSTDLIAAIVGVLKAGAAYVPLSPDQPVDRLRPMLEDSGARVVLSDRANESKARALLGPGVELLLLDSADASVPFARRPVSPEQLAYVIFTSGSTGRPKGAMIEHRSVVNLVHALRDLVYADLGPALQVALVASPVFDASVQQIFATLLQGHTLHIVPDDLRRDGERFCEWLREHRIDVTDGTPALLELMIHGGLGAQESSVRHMLIGGEPLSSDLVRQLRSRPHGRIAITNVYGPTECCVDVVAYRIEPGELPPAGASVPIGRPMRNCRAAIVDELGAPVRPGLPGELIIGGICVGRGYANNAQQTAERFAGFPLAGLTRAYRTGDLCRRRRDGVIEFLGRNDDQVKIRGHRIELGEVEHHLRAHPGIAAVTVQARPTSRGYRELVAYVVARAPLTASELRDFAADRMPGYMIPAYFVQLDSLPLNESGKIARQLLPDPEAAAPMATGTEYREAATDAEAVLTAAWKATLNLERVGVRDNYFASGGDSIKALQLASRLRDAGWTVAIRDIFKHPTIEELASHITKVDGAAPAPAAPFDSGRVALSAVQRFFFETYGATNAFNQAVLVCLARPLSRMQLHEACEALIRRHEMLRCRFVQDGTEWVQDIAPAGSVEPVVGYIDLRGSATATEDLHDHAAAAQRQFSLGRAPLWAVTLFDMPDGQRALLTAHHLVVDGVSWRILIADLERALDAPGSLALLPAPTPYANFVEEQRQATSSSLAAELPYWAALKVAPRAGAADRQANRRERRARVSPLLTSDVLTHAHHAYSTEANDLLITAVSRAWCAWQGERGCALTVEGHGREPLQTDLDLSGTVGWFTSLYPVVIDLEGCAGVGDAIGRVKQALRAIPNKGAGYTPLRYLRGNGDRDLPGLPELAFNYLGRFDATAGGWFAPAREALPPTAGPDVALPWPLEVNAAVVGDALDLTVAFSDQRYTADDADRFLALIEAELEAIARHTIPSAPSIDRSQIEQIHPLTPLQEGLFFHSQQSPDSDAYFEQWSFAVDGDLDPELVRQSWNDLFARHEIFRSVFVIGHSGRPAQVVLRSRQCEVATIDLRAIDSTERAARLESIRVADRARGFKIDREPLVRLTLVQLARGRWEIIWSHHHLVLDGWSAGIVQSEFLAIYSARRANTRAALESPPAFGRFVRSLPSFDPDFWRAYLDGYEASAELPGRESSHASELARTRLTLSADTTARINTLCRAQGVTLSAFIQATWSILLARYAYSDDVVFGYVMSGREATVPGVERMVGMLINTIPLRVRLDAGETFRALLARLQGAAADLAARQHAGLVDIQHAAARTTPLFSHVVALENYPLDDALRDTSSAGFRITAAESYDRTHYGFDLVVLPGRDGLAFRFSWDRARHADDAMHRLAEQLAHVIETVSADPDVVPCRINILPPAQWTAVVEAPNQTSASYPAGETILDRFDAQVRRQPDAPAVKAPHQAAEWLTYAELDARAHAIAAHLHHDLGVAAGSRVAVFVRPSIESIAGVLGVLKAGCTYVPIDPAYPSERVRFLLEDSGAKAVLTSAADRDRLDGAAAPLVAMDMLQLSDARDVTVRRNPDDVAYVIYTSGSTGHPKGCQVTHRNVVRLLVNERFDFDFSSADTWVMAHALSFDFSVWEIYGALLYGGRLVVPPRETVLDVPAFRQLLSRERVTVLNQTPLAFYNLVAIEDALPDHTLGAHLRYVIFGGDKLDVAALQPWARHYPAEQVALINMYGITETTVHVTYCRVDSATIARGEGSPIGRPLPETTVYVCDQHLNPQPLGARGEMLVGGSGVCAGYLNRPDLTDQRFIADAFSGHGRLYRSGDLAWRDAGGALQFIGRNDHQVKIRGHRIETGEVRHAILAIAGVEQAAVLTERGSSGFELMACVAGTATEDAIRAALAQRLPAHAIPSAIVVCDALPLTAHGKIDAAAIRALRREQRGQETQFEPPAGDREELLASIWSAVLGVERVGRHDRFIELGGDSIKSIQVLARVRAHGLTLDLKDVFAHPTIAELAPMMREAGSRPRAVDDGSPFALTPIQARFFETHPIEPSHFNHALLLSCRRRIDERELRGALQSLLDAHPALRLRFNRDEDGNWRQAIAAAGEPISLTVRDLSAEPDPAHALYLSSQTEQTGMDLARGPLFRSALYRMPDGDRVLLVAHHLTVDGVTWRVLLDDLTTLLSGGSLPPASDSWRQWAESMAGDAAMHQRARGELAYWQRVDREPAAVEPRLRDAGSYADAVEELLEYGPGDTADLRAACHAYQTNIGELLLAAIARALGRWTGTAQMQIALESHGRGMGGDVSRTAGWFTALYPFVLDLGDAPIGDRVRRLKEGLRQVPNGGAGYGMMRYLGIAAAASLHAQPPLSFNYLGELVLDRDALLTASRDPIASSVSPRGPRPFALDIGAIVIDGCLRLSLTFAASRVDADDRRRVRDAVDDELRRIVAHCLALGAQQLTPADLTHTALSLDELDALFDDD